LPIAPLRFVAEYTARLRRSWEKIKGKKGSHEVRGPDYAGIGWDLRNRKSPSWDLINAS